MTRNGCHLPRRSFLVAAGAGTFAGLSGCLGDSDAYGDPETLANEYPPYASGLQADDGPVFFSRVNLEKASEVDNYKLGKLTGNQLGRSFQEGESVELSVSEYFPDGVNFPEAYPAAYALQTIEYIGFFGYWYPFINNFDYIGSEGDETDSVVSIDSATFFSEAFVVDGKVDIDSLKRRKDAQTVESHGDYKIFESEASSGTYPFAVSADEVVLPVRDSSENDSADGTERQDPQTLLEGALDSEAAGVDIDSENLDWLVRKVGDGAMVLILHDELSVVERADDEEQNGKNQGANPDENARNYDEEIPSEFESLLMNNDANTLVMAADIHKGTRVTRSGFGFPDEGSVPDVDEIVDVIASDATEVNALTDGPRVIVEAFWDTDESGNQTEDGTKESGGRTFYSLDFEFIYSDEFNELSIFYMDESEVLAGEIYVEGPAGNYSWATYTDIGESDPIEKGDAIFVRDRPPYDTDVSESDHFEIVHNPPDGEAAVVASFNRDVEQ